MRVIQMAIIAIKEKVRIVAMQVTLLQRGVIILVIIRWVIRMVAAVVLLIVGKNRRRREIKNNLL